MNFLTFKAAVAKQFERMQKHQMFRVDIDKDAIWDAYLGSFPEGSNPLYRERTEHDCSCCKQFIRAVGSAVAVIDGELQSVWDIKIPSEPEYQAVADRLSKTIKSCKIADEFLHYERHTGTNKNFEDTVNGVKTWEHFFVNVDPRFVKKNADIASLLSESRSTKDVFLRSLTEISDDAISTVLELISQNSLYRGAEHNGVVLAFEKLKKEFSKLKTDRERELFAWSHVTTTAGGAVARIRNTVIGTLLTDLSEGKDLEDAVKMFESKVAPANYKRPTALVTKAMIENAKQTVEELGLTSALRRRYATLADISINNVLFASSETKKVISGDVFDELASETSSKVSTKNLDKIEEISIEKFLSDVVPRASSIEVLLENRHTPSFVSLIAPVDPTSGMMFKWNNRFSWSYTGEIADSDIRQAVKSRGGRVDGVFRFSHSWNHDKRNASLMDLHVFMPGNGAKPENGIHDNYGNNQRVGWNHRNHAATGGVQDVDYTAEAPVGYVPVENITFPSLGRMPEGRYICKIHNWQHRHPTQGGFRAEIEFDGQVFEYVYDKPLKNKEWVTVAEVTLKAGKFTIKHHLPESTSTKTVWGLPTQTFHPVSALMMSPNHWDGEGIGNKHYFFMLDGCTNDGTSRGFFNEFLKEDLTPHRKVLEMVGGKMKVEDSVDQMSGLGFSSTQRNSVVVRVKGSFTRQLKITF